MILAPVYCSSDPPPASGPVRSKMTPILIFLSWASAEAANPSAAPATISPPSRRAALRTSINTSLEDYVLCFWFLLTPITRGALGDVKRLGLVIPARAPSREAGIQTHCALVLDSGSAPRGASRNDGGYDLKSCCLDAVGGEKSPTDFPARALSPSPVNPMPSCVSLQRQCSFVAG